MINLFKPNLGEEEIQAVAEVLKSGWVAMGPKVAEFEKQFSKYVGSSYALATNSATAGLHLALMVLGVEKKEVITTAMTFVSTNHAILYNNGIPVFTDIEEDTLNIDPYEIEKNITPETKAIVVVHYGGHACDMHSIMNIAQKYKLKVVEDCAHAMGGKYKGKALGTIGDMGVFSFHGVKNITTGDGGMIVTDNKEYYEKIKKLRRVGMDKDTFDRENDSRYSWYYNIDGLGYKYHMNDIAAAIGIEQLKKVEAMNTRRREITEKYNQELIGISGIRIPVNKEYALHANHNYVIKTQYRNELNEYLAQKGISTGVHYIPNNHYEMYKGYGNPTPITEAVWTQLLSLPIYPTMTEKDQESVIQEIKNFFTNK